MVFAIVMLGAPAPPPPPPAGGPLDGELGQDVRAEVVVLDVFVLDVFAWDVFGVDLLDALLLDVHAAKAPPSSAAMASVVPTLRVFLLVMIYRLLHSRL
jgi:hypothetical protein